MKFNWKMVCTGFAAAILLTACGIDNAEQQDEANPNESEQVVDETNGSSTDGASTDTGSNSDSAGEDDSAADEMADAVLTKSDAQSYSMKVLPGFTLTSEEPGRDSLYADDNPEAFMRIETQSNEDGTYAYLVENMQEVLKAASDGEELEELTDVYTELEDKGIKNAKAFKVDSETGPVTGVVFEKDGMVVRLTIFDNIDEQYKADFLSMGETIQ